MKTYYCNNDPCENEAVQAYKKESGGWMRLCQTCACAFIFGQSNPEGLLVDIKETTKVPFPDNPEHVDNLTSIGLLEAQGFKGPDADLATSLFEYGLIWRELEDRWLFIHEHSTMREEYERCTIEKDTNPTEYWEWVSWEAIAKSNGCLPEELLVLPFPVLVHTLFSYYGTMEVFGEDYYRGFKVEED